MKLKGKVALVTGASTGIGKACAVALAKEGADLALTQYRTSMDETANAVRKLGVKVKIVKADVSDGRAVNNAVEQTLKELGRIDILLSNAGIARTKEVKDMTDEEWDEVVNPDLKGAFYCVRAVLPSMIKQKKGRIIFTSSIAGSTIGWYAHAHYGAAKGGIEGFVKSLAAEVAPDGITVNAILPGIIETPMSTSPVHSLGPEGLKACTPLIPVGYLGRPEDIAPAVIFLAADDARYITGQFIIVDGGFCLSMMWKR